MQTLPEKYDKLELSVSERSFLRTLDRAFPKQDMAYYVLHINPRRKDVGHGKPELFNMLIMEKGILLFRFFDIEDNDIALANIGALSSYIVYQTIVNDIRERLEESNYLVDDTGKLKYEYKDILVDAVAINRWATKAVESTLPGIVSGLLLNYYLYKLQNTTGMSDISKYGDLKNALLTETIKLSELKKHAYAIYKCSDADSSIGMLYRQKIDEMLDDLLDALAHGSFDAKSYLTGVFDHCYYHVMSSLRDTDKQIIVEMK